MIIFFSILLLEIHAKLSWEISNLYFDFPEEAIIEFWVLYSYPEVILTSSDIFSSGLKVTNNLASRSFFFGDCSTGFDWAKQTLLFSSEILIAFQSLNFPISFRSSARTNLNDKKK